MSAVPSVAPDAISQLSAQELRRSVWRRWGLRSTVVIGWVVFVGVWYLFSSFLGQALLPPLHTVVNRAWELITEGGFGSNLISSVTRLVGGFLLALVAGTGVGLLIAYNDWWRNLLQGPLQLIISLPTISLAVMTLILFGISPLGPVLMTMLVATPYITMNVAQGITGVDRKLIVMSEAFGRTRRQIVKDILVPSSILSTLGGARLAFAVAWRMELLAEVFASSQGIGFQIRRSFESYDTQAMLAWTVLFVAVMLLFENFVLRRIDRWAGRWRMQDWGANP